MFSEVSSFQRLSKSGTWGGKMFSEVSSFQRLKCKQEWYLGWENVSCLVRCPQFRSVLIERAVQLYSILCHPSAKSHG